METQNIITIPHPLGSTINVSVPDHLVLRHLDALGRFFVSDINTKRCGYLDYVHYVDLEHHHLSDLHIHCEITVGIYGIVEPESTRDILSFLIDLKDQVHNSI